MKEVKEMETADYIRQAQLDDEARERLIKEYSGFINSCASKTAGRFIDKSDDVYSEALIAFNDAITYYDKSKGEFIAFAGVVIHNRINDYFKKQNRHNHVVTFSSLSSENDNGDTVDFEIEDKNSGVSDTALEIYSIKAELQKFGIDFFDIPSASPKAAKTRRACVQIAKYIVNDKGLLHSVYEKNSLPVKQITEALKVNKKILERHRKYIIMGILILSGEYEIMTGYFDCKEGGRK